MKHRLTKIAALVLIVCFMAMPSAGCLQVDGDRVALTLDGERFSRSEALLYFYYSQYDTEYNIYSLAESLYGGMMNYWAYSSGDYSSIDMLREDAMQDMIQTKVLNKQAAKDGITLDEEEEKLLTRTVNRFMRENEAIVNAAEASKDTVTQFIRENMIANKEYMYITNSIDTSYDEEEMTRKRMEGIIIAPKVLDQEEELTPEEEKVLIEKYVKEAETLFKSEQTIDLITGLYEENTEIGVTSIKDYELKKPEGYEEGMEATSFDTMAWPLKTGEYGTAVIENSDGSYVGYIGRCVSDKDEEFTSKAVSTEMANRRKTQFEEMYTSILASYKNIHVYTEVVNDFNVSATLYDGSDYEDALNGESKDDVYYIE